MIDDYRGLAVFTAVVDAGSFSAAGRRLKLSTSVVSHHVSRLEEKLGVSLLFRSTRSLSLTPEGKAILPMAQQMVEAGEAAIDALVDSGDQPVGTLRVSLPGFGFKNGVQQTIWRFAMQYPSVSLSLNCSDVPVDLIRDGFDLAIRLGTLSDSNLKRRKIGDFERALVGAPKYLERKPAITSTDDLSDLDFISVSMLRDRFDLVGNGRTVTIDPEKTRVEVDSIVAAKSALLAGLGIRHMPFSEIADELAAGTLVQLLPGWQLPTLGIYAVWPDSGPQKKLARRLIEAFIEDVGSFA